MIYLGIAVIAPQLVHSKPIVDSHTHILSPQLAEPFQMPSRTAANLISEMDASGVVHAFVLSEAYTTWFLPDSKELAVNENNFVAAEVAQFSSRLTGFCSAPLQEEWFFEEIRRCLELGGMKGIKLHLANNGIDLSSENDKEKVRKLLSLAAQKNIPVLIHPAVDSQEDFMNYLVTLVFSPAKVITAHGLGLNFRYWTLLDEFADPQKYFSNLYMDTSTLLDDFSTAPVSVKQELIWSIKKLGAHKLLWGSDTPVVSIKPSLESLITFADVGLGQYRLTVTDLRKIQCENAASIMMSLADINCEQEDLIGHSAHSPIARLDHLQVLSRIQSELQKIRIFDSPSDQRFLDIQ
jgi:predicted TIM-barrel fold metal-dependent hydrolase